MSNIADENVFSFALSHFSGLSATLGYNNETQGEKLSRIEEPRKRVFNEFISSMENIRLKMRRLVSAGIQVGYEWTY